MQARAFLQRFEAQGVMDEQSLVLGYEIETKLGAEKSANRYRLELEERFPGSAQAGRAARQE